MYVSAFSPNDVLTVNLWNSLPESVVTAPDIQSFKRGLEQHIPDKLVEYL